MPSPSASAIGASAGQFAAPSHTSAVSHGNATGRHSVPAAATASAGHVSLTPSHESATSHAPEAERHTAVLFTSAGQTLLTPLHVSATSHTPPTNRHTPPAGATASGGHAVPVPVHASATSHTLTDDRQIVPDGWNPSAGHAALSPVHASTASHGPAASRPACRAAPGRRAGTVPDAVARLRRVAEIRPSRQRAVLFASTGTRVDRAGLGTSHTPADERHGAHRQEVVRRARRRGAGASR